MTLSEIDEQIREVENRIAVERITLEDAVDGCFESVREVITSPTTLLTLLGVGFAVGKMVFRGKAEPQQTGPVKKAGALGFLTGVAGTALSLAGSRWGSMATWAARKYFSRKKANQVSPASPVSVAPAVPRRPVTRA